MRAAVILVGAILVVGLGAMLLVRTLAGSGASAAPHLATSASGVAVLPPPSASAERRAPEVLVHILDSNGDPGAGATVRLLSAGAPPAVLREALCDAEGSFSFARVGASRVRVAAAREPGGVVTSVELATSAETTAEVTLVLAPAKVRGTVVDGDGHAVAGAALSVEGVPWDVPGATTDAAGAFDLGDVPPEATAVVAVASGYREAHAPLAPRENQAELALRVVLDAAPPVEGDVLDPDGNPARARVVACEGRPAEAHAESAEDGTFRLPPSTLGCDVVALHDELESDTAPVLEGRRVTLRLKPGGALEGMVVDERGAAVDAFTVGVESFLGTHGQRSRGPGPRDFDAAHGAFRLEKLAPGTYVLSVSAAGKPPVRSDPVDVHGGATTKGVRVVLARGGTIVGRVFDENHVPLADVDLRFDLVSSVLRDEAAARSDDSGRYRLEGAPAGPFTLRVQKDGYRVRLVPGLRVDSGRTLTEDITLASADGGPSFELAGIGAIIVPAPGGGVAFGSVSADDPAGRAGLHGGDRVTKIDGEDAAGMSVADAIQRLRGEPGSVVGISVQRGSETIDVVVVRAVILR